MFQGLDSILRCCCSFLLCHLMCIFSWEGSLSLWNRASLSGQDVQQLRLSKVNNTILPSILFNFKILWCLVWFKILLLFEFIFEFVLFIFFKRLNCTVVWPHYADIKGTETFFEKHQCFKMNCNYWSVSKHCEHATLQLDQCVLVLNSTNSKFKAVWTLSDWSLF